MKNIVILISVLLISIFNIDAQKINTDESIVNFKAGKMKLRSVKGTFAGMKGNIAFDKDNIKESSFNVCIDAASVTTKSEKRDKHLRTEDFFFVEKYPTICIQSTKIINKGDGYILMGNLTIRNVTNSVAIPFSFKDNTFIGEFSLNRFDYEVGKEIGTFLVSEDIDIEIICKIK